MRMDKLTVKTQEALQAAQGIAAEMQHSDVGSLHLLAALLREQDGVVRPLVAKIGVDANRVAAMAEGELKRLPAISGGASLNVSRDLNEVLMAAQKEADALKDEYLSTEH